MLSLPALTSRCERGALARERQSSREVRTSWSRLRSQPLDQNTGPVDRPTPTAEPKLLYVGANPWVSRVDWRVRDGLELAVRLSVSRCVSLTHCLFKGHHKWVFASKVLINKKCCLSCFSVDDLSRRDVCVIKSLNCVCLFLPRQKNDCEKKLIFISLRAHGRTGPTPVSVHTWPSNKGFISKS